MFMKFLFFSDGQHMVGGSVFTASAVAGPSAAGLLSDTKAKVIVHPIHCLSPVILVAVHEGRRIL
jgi:hypothetical protein